MDGRAGEGGGGRLGELSAGRGAGGGRKVGSGPRNRRRGRFRPAPGRRAVVIVGADRGFHAGTAARQRLQSEFRGIDGSVARGRAVCRNAGRRHGPRGLAGVAAGLRIEDRVRPAGGAAHPDSAGLGIPGGAQRRDGREVRRRARGVQRAAQSGLDGPGPAGARILSRSAPGDGGRPRVRARAGRVPARDDRSRARAMPRSKP